jgi:hypothetical protein
MFDGYIQHVALWSRPLTPEEMLVLIGAYPRVSRWILFLILALVLIAMTVVIAR